MNLLFQITLIVFLGTIISAGAAVAIQMILYARQRHNEHVERDRIESKVDKTTRDLLNRQEATATKTDVVAVKVDAARVQAVEAARLLKANQDRVKEDLQEAARLLKIDLDSVKQDVQEASEAARNLKKDILHIRDLVNSRYTKALRGELTATKLLLSMMRKDTGVPPTEEDIHTAEERIDALIKELEGSEP
jgi:hypothetical protein